LPGLDPLALLPCSDWIIIPASAAFRTPVLAISAAAPFSSSLVPPSGPFLALLSWSGLPFLHCSFLHGLSILDVSTSPESAPRVFLAPGDVLMASAVALPALASLFSV
jgi:hypothetical protein